jgi:RNA-binding protein YlmH
MERIVVARLVEYLVSNNLLSALQFGFRKARLTEDQMLLVYSEVAEMVDEGIVVYMALVDISKSFDVVSHNILLEKLRSIGVSEVLMGCVCVGFFPVEK